MLGRACRLRADQLEAERDRDPAGDLVLQGEQIAGVAVEPVRPQMRATIGIDQVSIGADLVTRAPDASFQQIAHAKVAADLALPRPLCPCR